MTEPRRFGRGGSLRRRQHALSIDSAVELPRTLNLGEGTFACLLLLDGRALPVEDVAQLVERLLDAGCVYLTTWGPDAERLHDVADEVLVERGLARGVELEAMTTWLADEPLDEALWQHLHLSEPFAVHEAGCRAGLVLAIGQPDAVSRRVEHALRRPEAFSDEVLRREPDSDAPGRRGP